MIEHEPGTVGWVMDKWPVGQQDRLRLILTQSLSVILAGDGAYLIDDVQVVSNPSGWDRLSFAYKRTEQMSETTP